MFNENATPQSLGATDPISKPIGEILLNEESRLAEYAATIPRTFAQSDLLYLISQYLHGERYAVAVAEWLQNDPRLTPELREAADQFLAEERKHVALLDDSFRRLGLQPYGCHPKVKKIYDRLLSEGSLELALAALSCLVEPFGLGSIIGVRSSLTDVKLSQTLDAILEDEGKHLKLGPDWLNLMKFDFGMGSHLAWAQELFDALTESTKAEIVFAEYWPRYWEKNLWMERALHSKVHSRQSVRVLAAIFKQLNRIPNGPLLRHGIERSLGTKEKERSPSHTKHPHYDDGNALFEHIIGPTMAYSSGIWQESKAQSLEQAQEAKFARIANYSGITSETRHVADFGCGWGGYLSFVGRHNPTLQTGIGLTISAEQARWFAMHNQDKRLSIQQQSCFEYFDKISDDTRFDAVSSIEALEHFASPEDVRLGRHREIYRHFFKSVAKHLDGKFGFETIVATKNISLMPDHEKKKALRFALFMLRDVYPHSHLSSPSDIAYAVAPYFRTLEFEVDHRDYSLTLQAWLDNLSNHPDMQHDPRFALYKRYFEMCIEQFDSGAIGIIRASFQTR